MKAPNLGLVLVDYGPKRLKKQTDRLTLIVTGSNVPTWQAQCCIDRGTLLRRSRSGSEWHGKPKIKKRMTISTNTKLNKSERQLRIILTNMQ